MNLNEICLLRFLVNPDEIEELTKIFIDNNEEMSKSEKKN